MNIFNGQFRDVAANATYPFTGDSTLVQDRVSLPSALFLDALVYPLGGVVLPLHLSKLAPTPTGGLSVEVSDNNRLLVGVAELTETEDSALVVDPRGAAAGTITYDPTLVQALLGQLNGRTVTLAKNVAILAGSTTFVMQSSGLVHVDYPGGSLTGEVDIVAGNGIVFTVSGDGVVRIHLYGEEPFSTVPISRIRFVNAEPNLCCENPPDVPTSFDVVIPDPVIFADPGSLVRDAAAIRVLTTDAIEIATLEDL
jgi:hypothetical protein